MHLKCKKHVTYKKKIFARCISFKEVISKIYNLKTQQ